MPYSLIFAIYLFFITILFFVPARPLMDADTGWHIMAGHEILKSWKVPEQNIFSFTSGDFPWLNLSWLWDVLASMIDSLGGLYLLSAFTIVLGGLTMATLTWFCLNRGAGTVASLFAVTFGIFGFMPALLVRPHQFTNIFTLCFSIILFFYARKPEKHKKLLFLPPIMLLWANMHGGFFTGFTILAAYLMQFLFDGQFKQFKKLLIMSLCCFGFVFINPLGINIFEAAYRTLGGPMKAYISEWRSPSDVRDFIYIGIFLLVFIPTFKIHNIAEKVLCVFWLIETFIAVRNMPIFTLISVPVLANGIVYLGGRFQRYRDREHDYTVQFSGHFMSKWLPMLAIYLSLGFMTPQWANIIGFSPASTNFPKAEIDYILQNHPQARLFNQYDYGGYVIYESKGQMKTFIDGRAETAFPPAIVKDYLRFDTAEQGWEAILDKYNVDTALVPKELGIQKDYFDQNWQHVFTGNQAIVYIRK